jgi:hypothetical protein
MSGDDTERIFEAAVRLVFLGLVLWLFAASFDQTEWLTLGLLAVIESILFWVRKVL